jgi:hypothetical protein
MDSMGCLTCSEFRILKAKYLLGISPTVIRLAVDLSFVGNVTVGLESEYSRSLEHTVDYKLRDLQ